MGVEFRVSGGRIKKGVGNLELFVFTLLETLNPPTYR